MLEIFCFQMVREPREIGRRTRRVKAKPGLFGISLSGENSDGLPPIKGYHVPVVATLVSKL